MAKYKTPNFQPKGYVEMFCYNSVHSGRDALPCFPNGITTISPELDLQQVVKRLY